MLIFENLCLKFENLMISFGILMALLPNVMWQDAFSVTATPAQFRGSYYDDSKCIDGQTGRELLIGDSFMRSGICVRVQCLHNLQIWEDRCQTPKLPGNCTRIPAANEFLEYPKCCPMFECTTYEEDENGKRQEIRLYDTYGIMRKTRITQVFTHILDRRLPNSPPPRAQFEV